MGTVVYALPIGRLRYPWPLTDLMPNEISARTGRSDASKISEGLLNIDKPGGITSHDVVKEVRRLAGLRRVGHAGTLDPLATGVLLVCIGRTTRLVEYLVGRHKEYETTFRLGQGTDTYDAEGAIIFESDIDHLTQETIAEGLRQFTGIIQQRPPMYSAVKQGGQPLYKLARQGKQAERRPRQVTVYELDLVSWQPPLLNLRIVCSSGTYVRALAHDLGEALECGGHVTALRRTAVGMFRVESAVRLAALSRETLCEHLQNSDVAVSHLPRLQLSEVGANELRHGRTVKRRPEHPEAPLTRGYDSKGRFIGVIAAESHDGEHSWRPRKIFHPVVDGS